MRTNRNRCHAFSSALFSVLATLALQAAAQSSFHNLSASASSASSTSSAAAARFEIASVKLSGPKQMIANALLTYPGARVVALGATLRFLIKAAYNLPPAQITGGPAWIDKTRFDIEAKPPADVASRYMAPRNPKNPPPAEIRQMLQDLLVERFHLKVHTEEKEGRIYELVKNGHPLRLSTPKDTHEFPWAGGVDGGYPETTGLRGTNDSMADLAHRLTEWLVTPVIDRTGLSGSFDFVATIEPDEVASLGLEDSISQSLEQLGLKLTKSTGTIQSLVIDNVSLPSDN
jgi:uncharacterized protein (TIGR03435 family)